MAEKDWRGWAVAAALAALVAFPAGMMFSGRGAPAPAPTRTPSPDRPAAARNPWSPDIMGDPYVIEQLRRQVEGMEDLCRRTRRYCVQARQMRQHLKKRI